MAAEHDEDTDERLGTPTKAPATRIADPRTPEKAPKSNVERDDEDEDGEEEEDEPKLKYSRLTTSLGGVYRSGDSTSSVVLSGDKMV
jgi:vacuolar protein sorting-associated protein 41